MKETFLFANRYEMHQLHKNRDEKTFQLINLIIAVVFRSTNKCYDHLSRSFSVHCNWNYARKMGPMATFSVCVFVFFSTILIVTFIQLVGSITNTLILLCNTTSKFIHKRIPMLFLSLSVSHVVCVGI